MLRYHAEMKPASAPAATAAPADGANAPLPPPTSWAALERDSPVGLFLTDADGVFTDVNARWCELTGIPATRAAGTGWAALLHRDDRGRIGAALRAAVAAGAPFGEEFRMIRADGGMVWVLAQAEPRCGADGAFSGYLGVLTDISERKHAEEALRRGEARFRALATSTAAAIWTIDATGDLLDAPENRWPYLTDLPAAELASEWLAAVHPDDRAPGNACWWAGIAAGQPFAFTQRVRQRDGSFRHFQVRGAPVREADGTIREWVGADIDITERMRAEQALAESEARFRALAQSVPSIVWTAAPDGAITYASDQWFAFAGITPEANATQWPELVLHPDDRDRCLQAWSRALATGEDYQIEVRNRRHDGEYCWFLTRAVAARDVSGAVTGWYGSTTDIHEAKLAQDRLRASEHALQSAIAVARLAPYSWDPLTGELTWNDTLKAMWGLPVDAQVNDGLFLAGIHPDDRLSAEQRLAEAIDPAGDGVYQAEFRVIGIDDRIERWVAARGQTIFDADRRPLQLVGVAQDVTERKRTEEQLISLQAVTAALSAALTPSDVYRAAIQGALGLGVAAGALYLVDGDALVLADATGFASPLLEQYRRVPRSTVLPATEAVERATPVWIRSRQDYIDRFPHRAGLIGQVVFEGAVSLPVIFEEQVLGVLNLTFAEAIEPEDSRRHYLLLLASLVAQALERSRLYAEARAAGERFARAEVAAKAFSYEWDVTTGRIERSAGLQAVLGYKPGDLASTWDAWNDVIHPDDRIATQAEVLALHDGSAEATPIGYEYRVRHKDGSYRWIHEREAALRDADGAVRRVIGSAVDVTERKQAEERLRASEQQLRLMADAMPHVVWIADPEGTVRYYNNRVATFGAGMRADHDRWDWRPVIHPDDLPATFAAWQQAVQRKAPYTHEHRIQMADGAYRWHLSRAIPVLDGSGQIQVWYGTATDIHDLKQAEIALQENDARLRLGIEVAGFALAEIDFANGEVQLTPEAAALFGLGEEAISVTRAEFEACVHPDDRASLHRQITSPWRSGREGAQTSECRVVQPAGDIRWLSVRTRVLVEGGDHLTQPARIVLAALDVTERKRAEAGRRTLLDALAHDLRNPLTTWKIQLQLLRRQLSRGEIDPATVATRVDGFEALADRMTDLLEELDDLAQLSTAQESWVTRQPTDLVALVRDGIATAAAGTDRVIRLETGERDIVGEWDGPQLQRVVANLLSNAVKYSPAESTVGVRLHRSGNTVTLEVRDEGIGIPALDLPNIFTFRHRGGNVGAASGGGVGLASVKQIVERHGGTVEVDSIEGAGSTFRVRLPLRQGSGGKGEGGKGGLGGRN